jgi:hypothetical protein
MRISLSTVWQLPHFARTSSLSTGIPASWAAAGAVVVEATAAAKAATSMRNRGIAVTTTAVW